MIIYELQCPLGHRFEGWFRNNQAFEAQQRANLVQCAVCGTGHIERLAVGGHLQTGAAKVSTPDVAPAAPVTPATPVTSHPKAQRIPVDPITLLKALQHHVKTHYADVGDGFAHDALAIHRGEAPMRAIYGTTTAEGKAQLDDAGVDYLPLPALPETVDN